MKMSIEPLTKAQVDYYLSLPDLTKKESNHAVSLLYRKIKKKIESTHPDSEIMIYRDNQIVSIEDNYENLLIPADNISRSSTYTHYVDDSTLLRTHASSAIPSAMRQLANIENWDDVVILVPGLVYRRDVADKKHVGQIHMLDVWRVVRTANRPKITHKTLLEAVKDITETAAPGWKLRIEDSPHPYTDGGIEVNAVHETDGRDIEILECGLTKERVLEINGLDPEIYSGWALGMGLDRLVMTLKYLPDIRYLRSENPKIAEQMKDLDAYNEVSSLPAIQRDMSYSVPETYVEEDVSQDIMSALGVDVSALEEVEILSETRYEDLPDTARKNLGIQSDQKNVLVRVTLRHLEKTLTKKEANIIYDSIYQQINYGLAGYSS
jgi:phenylalanyl-tRNA synthetase alpha chain